MRKFLSPHAVVVESHFKGGATISVYLKRGMVYSLPDCQYGVVRLFIESTPATNRNEKVISGIVRGRGFKIVVSIEINHIFSVVRSGSRGGITLAQ